MSYSKYGKARADGVMFGPFHRGCIRCDVNRAVRATPLLIYALLRVPFPRLLTNFTPGMWERSG